MNKFIKCGNNIFNLSLLKSACLSKCSTLYLEFEDYQPFLYKDPTGFMLNKLEYFINSNCKDLSMGWLFECDKEVKAAKKIEDDMFSVQD